MTNAAYKSSTYPVPPGQGALTSAADSGMQLAASESVAGYTPTSGPTNPNVSPTRDGQAIGGATVPNQYVAAP